MTSCIAQSANKDALNSSLVMKEKKFPSNVNIWIFGVTLHVISPIFNDPQNTFLDQIPNCLTIHCNAL